MKIIKIVAASAIIGIAMMGCAKKSQPAPSGHVVHHYGSGKLGKLGNS